VTFLEYWKRKSASLAHHWYCMGLQDEKERPRPEFAANAPYLEKNPITGIREPSFPKAVRMRRIAAGSGLIVLMVNLPIITHYFPSKFNCKIRTVFDILTLKH
jgi:anoctamin-7